MIFVTVGSDVPFSRLVKQVDLWSKDHTEERVFAQVGRLTAADYVPTSIEWTEMLEADQFDHRCAQSRLIVAHAGMGSIISALATGKPIVILPRRGHLRETRSDHQFATAERFADRPGIFVAWTEVELPEVIIRAMSTTENASAKLLPEFASAELTDRLHQYILQARRA